MKGFSRQQGYLLLIITADLTSSAILIPVLPYFGTQAGLEVHWVTLCMAIYPVIYILTSPWMGNLTDRWGTRPTLLLCIGLNATAYGLLILTPSLLTFALARLLSGIGSANATIVQSALGQQDRQSHVVNIMSWLALSIGLANILGPAIGSWMAGDKAHIMLTPPAILACAVSATAWLFAATSITNVVPKHRPGEGATQTFNLHYIRQSKSLRRSIWLNCFYGFATAVSMTLLPLWLFDRGLVKTAQEMVPVFVIPAVFFLALQLTASPWLIRRLALTPLLVSAFSVFILGYVIVVIGAQMTHLPLVIVGFVINGLSSAVILPALLTMGYHSSHAQSTTADLSIIAVATRIFRAVGVAISGTLYAVFIDLPFWVAMFFSALAVFYCLKQKPVLPPADPTRSI